MENVKIPLVDGGYYTLSVYAKGFYGGVGEAPYLFDEGIAWISLISHNGTEVSHEKLYLIDGVIAEGSEYLSEPGESFGWWRVWKTIRYVANSDPDYKYVAFYTGASKTGTFGITLDRPMLQRGPYLTSWTTVPTAYESATGISIDTAGIVGDSVQIYPDGVTSDILTANILTTNYVAAEGGASSTGTVEVYGNVNPGLDDTYDLGSSSKRWKDIYISRDILGSETVSLRSAASVYLVLPGLRGFWPMSSMGAGGSAYDLSGATRTLTYAGSCHYEYDGLIPYLRFDGVGDYVYRTDEGNLDILGTEGYVKSGQQGLTLGGWFWPDDITNAQGLISKWGAAGNKSYLLYLRGDVAGDPVYMYICDDGTNFDSVSSASGVSIDTWHFMAGRYNDADTGEELAVWINEEKTTGATSRNSIFNSTAPFNISGTNSGSSLFHGRASMCFLCAMALSDEIVDYIFQSTRSLFGV